MTLGFMASYLFVSFFGCRSFSITCAFQDGIFAESLLDVDECLLHPSLFLTVLLLVLFTLFDGFVVGEQVKLQFLWGFLLWNTTFAYDVIRGDIQASY